MAQLTAFLQWLANSPWLLSVAGLVLLALYQRQSLRLRYRQQQLRELQQLPQAGQTAAGALSSALNQNQSDPFLEDQDLSFLNFLSPLLKLLFLVLERFQQGSSLPLRRYFQHKSLQLQLLTPIEGKALSGSRKPTEWLRRQWLMSVLFSFPLAVLCWFQLQSAFIIFQFFIALIVWFVSALVLFSWRINRRLHWLVQACEQALPQALEQLARAVSAGMGVNQALAQVVAQLSPANHAEKYAADDAKAQTETGRIILARELEWLLSRLRIGDPPAQVIELAGQRLPLISYRFFGMTLLLNLQTGGRLAQVLARQSVQLKEAQRAKHKLDALTSEPRLSANVVAAIPMIMLATLAWLNPGHLDFLLSDNIGQQLLAYSLGSIALGLMLIRLMVIGGGR